jgi:hypothetical protein
MPVGDLRSILDRASSKRNLLDQKLLDELGLQQRRLGTTIKSGDPVVFTKERDNILFLESGFHGGFNVEKPGTIIYGAAGATINGPITVENGADLCLNNVSFIQTTKNTEAFVTVNSGGRFLINGCIFRKFPVTERAIVGSPSANSCYVGFNTTTLGENFGTIMNSIFIEDADSGVLSLVNGALGSALGTCTVAYSINRTTQGVGAGITATGVV